MEILAKANWVDVLIVILMIRISYVAFQDGLSHEIFPLVGSIVVATLTFHYYNRIALSISQNIAAIPMAILNLFTFITLALAIGFVCKFIKVVVDKIIKVTWHPLLERFGGLLAGVVKASIIISMVLAVIALTPIPYLQYSIRDRSLTGMYFLSVGPKIYEKVSHLLPVIKVETASAKSNDIINNIISDKSLSSQAAKKETKKKEGD